MSGKLRYITGIDGLRTIAVVFVLLYHLLPQYFPGGFIGVPLFFVISGYLMTAILLKEWKETKNIRIGNFYKRRIARLWPPLIAFFVAAGAIIIWINPDYLNHFRSIVVTTLLGVNNFWQLASDSSYFAKMSELSPFANLWSLSIENQFYLLWPIVFIFAFRWLQKAQSDNEAQKRRRILTGILIGGIILSAIFMGVNFKTLGLNQAYYNTLSRVYPMLGGALLAFVLEFCGRIHEFLSRWGGLFIGFSTVLLCIAQALTLKGEAGSTYWLDLPLNAIICTLLLGSVIACKPVNRLFSNPVFRYIGSRSYELYLWQYPIIVLYGKMVGITGKHLWLHVLIQLALVFLFAEITHRFVGFWQMEVRTYRKHRYFVDKKMFLTLLAVGVLFTGNFVYAFVKAPNQKKNAEQVKLEKQLNSKKEKLQKANKEIKEKVKEKKKTYPQNEEVVKYAKSIQVPGATMTDEEIKDCNNIPITIVGDSVLVGASSDFQGLDALCYIDAKVGRQMQEAVPILQQLKDQNMLQENVVLNLGNNGEIEDGTMDEILKIVGKRKLFLVNTNVKRYWQQEANDEMKTVADDHKNVYYIDWKSIADQNPDWFSEDGIHMGPLGNQVYTNLILKNILAAEKSDS